MRSESESVKTATEERNGGNVEPATEEKEIGNCY